jgi:hypothetical protein
MTSKNASFDTLHFESIFEASEYIDISTFQYNLLKNLVNNCSHLLQCKSTLGTSAFHWVSSDFAGNFFKVNICEEIVTTMENYDWGTLKGSEFYDLISLGIQWMWICSNPQLRPSRWWLVMGFMVCLDCHNRITSAVKSSGRLRQRLYNVAYNAKKDALEKGKRHSALLINSSVPGTVSSCQNR